MRSIDEATELFLSNERLVGFVVRQYFGGNSPEIQEEMREEGRYLLWKAALRYDPDRGAFSTWAVSVVRNGLLGWIQGLSRKRRAFGEMVSLSSPVGDQDSECTLADNIEAPGCLEDQVEVRETLEIVNQSPVGCLMAQGMTQGEIAKRLGQSVTEVALEELRLLRQATSQEVARKRSEGPRRRGPRQAKSTLQSANRLFQLLRPTRSADSHGLEMTASS